MSIRLLACSLLFVASLPVAARDARLADADGTPPCQAAAAAESPVASDANGSGNRRAPPASASRARSVSPGGGDSENIVRPPRWHSFLPGMFR
ncbi:hypothetical protein [Luteimonas cellulosilyticus]|uniref:hypothetical protein n=1 Tax=Luteimonas cellulosilyticus TaxID=2683586 RepID=UPI003CCD8272